MSAPKKYIKVCITPTQLLGYDPIADTDRSNTPREIDQAVKTMFGNGVTGYRYYQRHNTLYLPVDGVTLGKDTIMQNDPDNPLKCLLMPRQISEIYDIMKRCCMFVEQAEPTKAEFMATIRCKPFEIATGKETTIKDMATPVMIRTGNKLYLSFLLGELFQWGYICQEWASVVTNMALFVRDDGTPYDPKELTKANNRACKLLEDWKPKRNDHIDIFTDKPKIRFEPQPSEKVRHDLFVLRLIQNTIKSL